MNRPFLIFLLLFLPWSASAQELNCRVKVMAPQVQGAQPGIFKAMEKSVEEFMNDQKWTNDQFKVQERIDCNILINIKNMISNDRFEGSIQVQSGRIVFNSSYNSTIFNYNDRNFTIEYVQNTALRFSIDQHRSELTSILAYYAYMIIAHDYDTFSKMGGTKYFEKAQTIVNNAQSSGGKGWKAQQSKRNRYWLVDNYLNDAFSPLRECLYIYHRKGLDKMYDDPKEGRKKVMEALRLLEKVHNRRPGNINLQVFFTAKSDELVKIFSKGDPRMRNEAVRLLRRLDPSNSDEYNKIMKNR